MEDQNQLLLPVEPVPSLLAASASWNIIASLVSRVEVRFAATGIVYKTAEEPLCCTILACWNEGDDEPWLVLTDFPAHTASPCWYAFWAWIEQDFKVIKSGALYWQNTQIQKTERAEWRWLAVTVLWTVVIGAVVEGVEREETLGEVAAEAKKSAARIHRLFTVGLVKCLAAR